MKVKLIVSRAGIDFTQNAGDEITVTDKEGLALIQANQAEPITKIEKAAGKKATKKAIKA